MNQTEFWNGEGGARWVAEQERLDAVLEPLGAAVLAAARVQPGERVLDVGSGCGATALALAKAVGTSGSVVGVDVSAPMVKRARERAAALPNVSFVVSDATEYRDAKPFDLLFSRFGVMFFENPTLSFTALHDTLRKGGRLAFVCWRSLDENPWVTLPLSAVLPFVPPPAPTPPDAPGPFAFADRARVQEILEGAGWKHVAFAPVELALNTGKLDDAVEYAMLTGPTARIAASADDATRAKMRPAIREALRGLEKNGVVELPSAVWVVTATRGA